MCVCSSVQSLPVEVEVCSLTQQPQQLGTQHTPVHTRTGLLTSPNTTDTKPVQPVSVDDDRPIRPSAESLLEMDVEEEQSASVQVESARKRKALHKPLRKLPSKLKPSKTKAQTQESTTASGVELKVKSQLNKFLKGTAPPVALDQDILDAHQDRYLHTVMGVAFLAHLLSKNWKHREAAIRTLQEVLEEVPGSRSEVLWAAMSEVVKECMRDPVVHIYQHTLQLLAQTMKLWPADQTTLNKKLQALLTGLLPLMVARTGDSNVKTRACSEECLLTLATHPAVGWQQLEDLVLEEQKEVAPKLLAGKLTLMLRVLHEVESGRHGKHLVFRPRKAETLIHNCLQHGSKQVRELAIEVACAIQQLYGEEAVAACLHKVKPAVLKAVQQRVLTTNGSPQGQAQVERGLELASIPE